MHKRRTIYQLAAGAAVAVVVPKGWGMTEELPETRIYKEDVPLLVLQQKFLDLRFGMFIHFNMATYQDREWGNPKDAPDVFSPTNLDTDQ